MSGQQALVMNYIKKFGSITPIEAFAELGVTKLATRISELKTQGFRFEQEYVLHTNRFGKPVRFMRYSMEEKEND